MLNWLREKLSKRTHIQLEDWSVQFVADKLVINGGLGATHSVEIAAIRKVVVQTDDSGPWGPDFLYFLFADQSDPVGVFPLEAQGASDLVAWLERQPGFNTQQFGQAVGSTKVAQFVVFQAAG